MKKETHPEMHPVIFRDSEAKADFIGSSTATSEDKEVIDGIEYFVIPVEISSASHPFYTGEENIIDSAGRVEKFKTRAGKKATEGKKKQEVRTQQNLRNTKNILEINERQVPKKTAAKKAVSSSGTKNKKKTQQ